jgi:hypothetical protein
MIENTDNVTSNSIFRDDTIRNNDEIKFQEINYFKESSLIALIFLLFSFPFLQDHRYCSSGIVIVVVVVVVVVVAAAAVWLRGTGVIASILSCRKPSMKATRFMSLLLNIS